MGFIQKLHFKITPRDKIKRNYLSIERALRKIIKNLKFVSTISLISMICVFFFPIPWTILGGIIAFIFIFLYDNMFAYCYRNFLSLQITESSHRHWMNVIYFIFFKKKSAQPIIIDYAKIQEGNLLKEIVLQIKALKIIAVFLPIAILTASLCCFIPVIVSAIGTSGGTALIGAPLAYVIFSNGPSFFFKKHWFYLSCAEKIVKRLQDSNDLY